MPTPDYTAIRKTLEATLDKINGNQTLVELNKDDIQEAITITAQLENINALTPAGEIGKFIGINDARYKRAAFKTEFGTNLSGLPLLLRFNSLLVSAELLRQLLKFAKGTEAPTDLIQIIPAIRTDEGGKPAFTHIMVALDKDRKPILASDLPGLLRDAIRADLIAANRLANADNPADVADEIRLCPPERCNDIA